MEYFIDEVENVFVWVVKNGRAACHAVIMSNVNCSDRQIPLALCTPVCAWLTTLVELVGRKSILQRDARVLSQEFIHSDDSPCVNVLLLVHREYGEDYYGF